MNKICKNKSVLGIIENAQLYNTLTLTELYRIYQVFTEADLDLDAEIASWLNGTSTLSASMSQLLQDIIKFSISVIAQDLSVMISIAPFPHPAFASIKTHKRTYCYKISIVDVDYKSIKKLPVYLKQETSWED